MTETTGIQRIVIIDCQTAGVAGDMLLGALLDLGADRRRVSAALKTAGENLAGCSGLRLEADSVSRHGIRAIKAEILYEETVTERPADELRQAIIGTARRLELPDRAQRFVSDTVTTLLDAEQKIHGESGGELHLHELGSADTVADIIGTAVALEDLGFFRNTLICATPVTVGSGRITFSHGTVSVPGPAVLEILRSRNFPFSGGTAGGELATPTGVSLLVNLADRTDESYPAVRPAAVGYGAGTRELDGLPNVLRITAGEPTDEHLRRENICVLETNVDDVPGEVVGYTLERLFRAGARDCFVIPVQAKKNRPGQLIRVVADEAGAEQLARILMEETGTLGVRLFPGRRYTLDRETRPVAVEIDGDTHRVNVKIARDGTGRIINIKPEYEDIRALAYPVLRHRILINYRAEAEGITVEKLVDRLLESVKETV